MIEIKDILKQYDKVTAVDHVSFSVETGDIFGLLGPNGAGKTTFINILGGCYNESIDSIINLHGFIRPEHAIKTSNYFSQRYSIRPA